MEISVQRTATCNLERQFSKSGGAFVITLSVISSVYTRISSRSMKTYLNRFTSKKHHVVSKSTEANNWGNSATIYLDRHKIDCGIGALSQFQYKRIGSNKFKYDYKCLLPLKCNKKCEKKLQDFDKVKCMDMKTKPESIKTQEGKHTDELSKHKLVCPEEYVMTGFKMTRQNPNIRFDYKCCPAKTSNCKSKLTKLTPATCAAL
jgi:hypothetical protein